MPDEKIKELEEAISDLKSTVVDMERTVTKSNDMTGELQNSLAQSNGRVEELEGFIFNFVKSDRYLFQKNIQLNRRL